MAQAPKAAMPSMRLDGRTALVSGAGRGIGAGLAVGLAEAGADLVLLSRSRDELERVASRVEAAGRRAQVLVADVTDSVELRAAFAEVQELDILVNNAGTNRPGPFLELTEEMLDAVLDLNVRAALLVAQAAVAKMLTRPDRKERGGTIINISSQIGHVGASGLVVYSTTKHALEGFNKSLALELATTGIRVNAIAPTFVETDMSRARLADPEFHKSVIDRIPMGQIAMPSDLMGAVVFLASPAAAMITGASLLVDGGWTAQ